MSERKAAYIQAGHGRSTGQIVLTEHFDGGRFEYRGAIPVPKTTGDVERDAVLGDALEARVTDWTERGVVSLEPVAA